MAVPPLPPEIPPPLPTLFQLQAGRRIEAEDRCFTAATIALSETTRFIVGVTHLDQLSDPLRLEQVTIIASER